MGNYEPKAPKTYNNIQYLFHWSRKKKKYIIANAQLPTQLHNRLKAPRISIQLQTNRLSSKFKD